MYIYTYTYIYISPGKGPRWPLKLQQVQRSSIPVNGHATLGPEGAVRWASRPGGWLETHIFRFFGDEHL